MATSSILAENLFKVNGLVAVITGGGTGIGLMMAQALALNGAHKVYILGRREKVLQEAAASVPTPNIVPVVCDVACKKSLTAAAAKIRSEVGFINVLIANAGISGPPQLYGEKSLADLKEIFTLLEFDDYEQVFRVNTVAVFFSIMAFIDLLERGNQAQNVQQSSQVIATSSISGFNRSSSAGIAYAQSKAATIHMMKQLATKLTPMNIRSNVLCPGLFPSEMTGKYVEDEEFCKKFIPLNRLGSAEDIAGYILFMTSRAGGFASGDVTILDGGSLSMLPSTF